MNTHLCNSGFHVSKKYILYFLVIIAIVGIILGIWLSCNFILPCSQIPIFNLFVKPRFFHLYTINTIPLLAFYIFIIFSLPTILYFSLFLFYMAHGFCGMTVYLLYGSCGWLIRNLLMFSSFSTSILIWLFILYQKESRRVQPVQTGCIALLLSFLITIIDYLFISPFFGNLIVYF